MENYIVSNAVTIFDMPCILALHRRQRTNGSTLVCIANALLDYLYNLKVHCRLAGTEGGVAIFLNKLVLPAIK